MRIAVDDDANTKAKTSNLVWAEDAAGANQARCARFDHCLPTCSATHSITYRPACTAGPWSSSWRGTPAHAIPVAAHDREYGRMAHITVGFTHASDV